jgi:hypothetical protein
VADCVSITQFDSAAPSGQATLRILAPPGAQCLGNALTVTGAALDVQELPALNADATGAANWTWPVRSRAGAGMMTVTVTCTPGGATSVSAPAS